MSDTNDGVDEITLRRRIDEGRAEPDDYYDLADLLLATRRHREAIDVYRRALSGPLDDRTFGEIAARLARLLYDASQEPEAIVLSERALSRLAGAAAGPRTALARALHRSVLAHALWSENTPGAREAAGLALGDLREAIDAAEGAADVLAAAHSELTTVHGLLGNWNDAITAGKKCLAFDVPAPSRIPCLVTVALALRSVGRLDDAESHLLEALRLVEPSDQSPLPRIYYELGLVQKARGQRFEAHRTFMQALGALESHPYLHESRHFLTEVHWNLAEMEYETEHYDRARSWFARVLAAHLRTTSTGATRCCGSATFTGQREPWRRPANTTRKSCDCRGPRLRSAASRARASPRWAPAPTGDGAGPSGREGRPARPLLYENLQRKHG